MPVQHPGQADRRSRQGRLFLEAGDVGITLVPKTDLPCSLAQQSRHRADD